MITIGFDAKRAFLNHTGLGNYSRTLINSLAKHESGNSYIAYTPRETQPDLYHCPVPTRLPQGIIGKNAGSLWRSRGLVPQLKKDGVQIYHGLSNEIPYGLKSAGIRSVTTIHDLIFLKQAAGYKTIDRLMYKKKLDYAVAHSDHIVAISESTRKDLLVLTSARSEQVSVMYQSCGNAFRKRIDSDTLVTVSRRHRLPQTYILHVGGWNPRKNLSRLIEAVSLLPMSLRPPIVALGATPREVIPGVDLVFLNAIGMEEVPALYQMAEVVAYPSLAEGFGLPVLEAMSCGSAVLTSPGTSMEEVAQDAAVYADPLDRDSMANALRSLLFDSALRDTLITAGRARAAWFAPARIAHDWAALYRRVLEG